MIIFEIIGICVVGAVVAMWIASLLPEDTSREAHIRNHYN